MLCCCTRRKTSFECFCNSISSHAVADIQNPNLTYLLNWEHNLNMSFTSAQRVQLYIVTHKSSMALRVSLSGTGFLPNPLTDDVCFHTLLEMWV